jgi:3'-phosphoadenosine 5'-phosphosulfate sulfotransferase (PAPS reductase)/FAD synthetase
VLESLPPDLADFRDSDLYLCFSGGKDSLATGLVLLEALEAGLLDTPFETLFFDVGWDSQDTYDYIRSMESVLGPIRFLRATVPWPAALDVAAQSLVAEAERKALRQAAARRVAARAEEYALEVERAMGVDYSPFVRLCLAKGFPNRLERYCTAHLKADVGAAFYASLPSSACPVSVAGVRAEESALRATYPRREMDKQMSVEIWRPILHYTLDDVVRKILHHGLRPNPLYLGFSRRVGCHPCIMASKDELAGLPPERVAIIRLLEQRVIDLKFYQAEVTGIPRTAMPRSLFMARPRDYDRDRVVLERNVTMGYHWPIDEAVRWARTRKGEVKTLSQIKQQLPKNVGCKVWGLCDVAGNPDEEEDNSPGGCTT